ncbi:hypothetical protein C1701_21860 [Actinoalloteichus sp. AHMU CJ021]|uniref:hypothetical protein n=1 Tax=Actinoalloteichus cyanogriseus TaxID=2893586 RepID=UPI000412ACF3|nr:hypothetical protein C1701_21860 [Actinoalloteichus sp. AHMU CJ021]
MATVVVVPLVLAVVTEQYASWLALRQAGEQEVAAQRAVEEAEEQAESARPPLAVEVRQLGPDDWSWAFEDALDADELAQAGELLSRKVGGTPEESGDADEAMRRLGGLRLDEAKVDGDWVPVSKHHITLVGQRRDPVLVRGLEVRVVDRAEPPAGTLLATVGQGANDVHPVLVDLDSSDLRLHTVHPAPGTPPDLRPLAPYLDRYTLDLAEHEQHGFELFVVSRTCWCRWELVIEAVVDDQEETVVVRSDGTTSGAPFETIPWDVDWSYGPVVDGVRRGGAFHGYDMRNWTPF